MIPIILILLGIAAITALTTTAIVAGTKTIPFEDLFRTASKRWGVPMRLMVSIAAHESRFNPRAENEESAADARRARDVDSLGLMQILYPDTAVFYKAGIQREDLFDPVVNVDIGGQLLRDLLRRYPHPNLEGFHADAVAAYNAGSARFSSPGVYRNQDYVSAVYAKWRTYANA